MFLSVTCLVCYYLRMTREPREIFDTIDAHRMAELSGFAQLIIAAPNFYSELKFQLHMTKYVGDDIHAHSAGYAALQVFVLRGRVLSYRAAA